SGGPPLLAVMIFCTYGVKSPTTAGGDGMVVSTSTTRAPSACQILAKSCTAARAESLSSEVSTMALPFALPSGNSFCSAATKSPVLGAVAWSQSLPSKPKPHISPHQRGSIDQPEKGTLAWLR